MDIDASPVALHLALAERCIARQRELIARLGAQGAETRAAEELLALMIDTCSVMSASGVLLGRLDNARDRVLAAALQHGIPVPRARTPAG